MNQPKNRENKNRAETTHQKWVKRTHPRNEPDKNNLTERE